MNWISTKLQMWQKDCENLRKLGPFCLVHVGPEHNEFIEGFAQKHKIECERSGSKATFYPSDDD